MVVDHQSSLSHAVGAAFPFETETDEARYIHPCPFSPGYGIAMASAWRSLRIYQCYRLILAAILLGLFYVRSNQGLFGHNDANLFLGTVLAYFALVLTNAAMLWLRRPGYAAQAQIQIFVDIGAIALLAHAGGGAYSGLGMLMAVTMAAAGLLIGGRCALVFAALASFAVLAEQVYQHVEVGLDELGYTYAGAQGAAFFAIAVLAFVAAKRTEQSEALARQHRADLANLQQLNAHVIQHLQSGIVVIDERSRIVTANRAALALLNLGAATATLDMASPELLEKYRHWREQPLDDYAVLERVSGNRIQVRFTRFAARSRAYDMIFLEDDVLYDQRVQHSKLASLGRLTASIAHEIRNPLSALNHAAQLLAENPQLDPQDLRLTQIVVDNAARVNKVVESILQLSRRSQSRRVTLDLGAWLERFCADFFRDCGQADAYDCQAADQPARVVVDPDQLRQIMENLCGNALKYGGTDNGAIVVRIAPLHAGAPPCVEVIDRGPGIDPKRAGQIFEPFYTSSPTGTGLGLYIARELAELNQARLSHHPVPGGGSCFRLCLRDAGKIGGAADAP